MTNQNNKKLITMGQAKGDLDVTWTDCCTWACHSYQKKMKGDVEGPVLNAFFSKQKEEKSEEKVSEQTTQELFNLCFSSDKSLFTTSEENAIFLRAEKTQDKYQIKLSELQGINAKKYKSLLEARMKILGKDEQIDPTEILKLNILTPFDDDHFTNKSDPDPTMRQIYFEGMVNKIEDEEKKKTHEKKGKPNIIKATLEQRVDSQISNIRSDLWRDYCSPYAAIEDGEKGKQNKVKLAEYWAELTDGNRKIRALLDKKYRFDETEKKQIAESVKIKVDALRHIADTVVNLEIDNVLIGYSIERDKNISQYAIVESVWSLNDMIGWQQKKENKGKKLERTTQIIEYLPKDSTHDDALTACCKYGTELVEKLLTAYDAETVSIPLEAMPGVYDGMKEGRKVK